MLKSGQVKYSPSKYSLQEQTHLVGKSVLLSLAGYSDDHPFNSRFQSFFRHSPIDEEFSVGLVENVREGSLKLANLWIDLTSMSLIEQTRNIASL